MYMSILPARIYVKHMHVLRQTRPEEGTGCPGTGTTSIYETHVIVEPNLCLLQDQQELLTNEPALQPIKTRFYLLLSM